MRVNSTNQKTTPVLFKGNAAEYFGIWIVNLLLSIVTLGVYSAWAKVRRKKYFYNNTLIENVGFDYHAKPLSILKGRLIAVVLIILASVNPILQSLVLGILFLALPWLMVRGSTFNARNSSHRGLRFDFVGTFGKAVRVFIGLPLITMISFGLAAPYAAHEKNQFLVNNHKFGLSQFEMKRVVGGFYRIYFLFIAIPLLLFIAGIIVGGVMKGQDLIKAEFYNQKQTLLPNHEAVLEHVKIFNPQTKFVLTANQVAIAKKNASNLNDVTDHVDRVYSEKKLLPIEEYTAQTEEQELKKNEQKMDDIEFEQGVESATELAQEPTEVMGDIEMQARASDQQMQDWLPMPRMLMATIMGIAAYFFLILGFLGYLQSRIGNLIWNNTTLDNLSFESSLRARDFAWIYFSNIVAIMLTFGLATPWAQIRLARYRASKLSIVGDVDFDQFVGDKKTEVQATGEEIAEMFDVDLSFG